ncbi:MAG: HIT family protein, partial [Candidatus Nanohaloarchaea archaeon]
QLMKQPEQLQLVGETENFYAWLEYPQPRAKGHANIVPKEHKESILDFSPSEYHEAMNLLRETIEKESKGLEADGFSIAMNIKEAAGQMLPHAYIQIFPRFEGEENSGTPIGAIFPQKEELQTQEYFEETVKKVNSVNFDFKKEMVEPHPDSQKFKESSTERSKDDENEDESTESENRPMEEEQSERKDEVDFTKRGESIQWQ